jgi:hypothetical protein
MVDPSRDAAGVVQYDATNDATKYASAGNGYYPDHYSIRYTGSNDHHGVHVNCPIITHGIYLMINGGTNRVSNVTVQGIGVTPVEQMLYHVVSTGLLDNTSDFADFRNAMIDACLDMYPDNLDYLAAVKSGFHAIGVGPDLYVRDRIDDQGEEPGTLSCMSPDMIPRQTTADAATLTQIADASNSSLGQDILLGGGDHYVYFRIHNRGASAASGTFRLYISPVSTFPTPGSWHEVGFFDFPNVPAGGLWVPSVASEAITLPASVITAFGAGHYCFIGIIESDDDPAPDRLLIDNPSEFHNYISMSNNYAWRNVDIETVTPDSDGRIAPQAGVFWINGFGRRDEDRALEIDARDLPRDAQLVVWIPEVKARGLRVFDIRDERQGLPVIKVAGTIRELAVGKVKVAPVPMGDLVRPRKIHREAEIPHLAREHAPLRPIYVESGRVIRLSGLYLRGDEAVKVHFGIEFSARTGPRDVTLAFRELAKGEVIGQTNHVYQLREARRT